MKGALLLLCITAVVIVLIHDVLGPVIRETAHAKVLWEYSRALEQLNQKTPNKPSLEIVPGFRGKPERLKL